MRRLIRPTNKYPPKVRGTTGRITDKEHEFHGRYIWQIEIFCIPASGKITVLRTIQSLWMESEQSYFDEHAAKRGLQNMIDKIEASLEKVTRGSGPTKRILLPGAFK